MSRSKYCKLFVAGTVVLVFFANITVSEAGSSGPFMDPFDGTPGDPIEFFSPVHGGQVWTVDGGAVYAPNGTSARLGNAEPVPGLHGLKHAVGPEDFEALLEIDGFNFTGLSDTQWKINDPGTDNAGQALLIQMLASNGSDPFDPFASGFAAFTLTAFTVIDNVPTAWGSVALGTDTTSLDLHVSFTDTFGLGGTYDVSYDRNGTGLTPLATITGADYPFDQSPDRNSQFFGFNFLEDTYMDVDQYTFIPEPATLSLLALGILGLRRKRKGRFLHRL